MAKIKIIIKKKSAPNSIITFNVSYILEQSQDILEKKNRLLNKN